MAFGSWNGQADAATVPAASAAPALANGTSAASLSGTVSQVAASATAPAWFLPALQASLSAFLPAFIYWTPGVPIYLPQTEVDPDPTGATESYQPAGPTYTPGNAFFTPFGNGRACVTCHIPSSAMGLSLSSIRSRYVSSYGHDPLFAPVDGATCPKNVPASWVVNPLLTPSGGPLVAAAEVTSATALSSSDAAAALSSGTALSSAAAPASTSLSTSSAVLNPIDPLPSPNPPVRPVPSYGAPAYATILNKGLIRIALPVPKNAQFTVQVVSDPYGCNTDPLYDQIVTKGVTYQQLSVYRRPLMSANLKFKVNAIGVPSGSPAGNIMWDGRERDLSTQAKDAVRNHAQLHTQSANPLPDTLIDQMLQFESGIYTAQISDAKAGLLTDQGATGGPVALSADVVDTLAVPIPTPPAPVAPGMTLYAAWDPAKTAEVAQRASINRGEAIFNARQFQISKVAGVNNIVFPGAPGPTPVSLPGTCASCHGQINVGAGSFPQGQVDIGIGDDFRSVGGPGPATDLPIFRLTCTGGAATPFGVTTMLVNDPGKALITGQCADIGRFTIPTLRGLASRAPYFSDGSAPNLAGVVGFYNGRFQIGLSPQDQTDLVNFLNTL